MYQNLIRARFHISLFSFIIFCLNMNCLAAMGLELSDGLISQLYSKYREATDVESTSSARRLFAKDKLFEVHVKKLKEVNGFKIHNLMIKEKTRTNSDPLIYINNPVESKLPKAYLTLEEFKNALMKRIQAQKDELAVKRQVILDKMTTTEKPRMTKVSKKVAAETTKPMKYETSKELNKNVEDVETVTSANVSEIIREENLVTNATEVAFSNENLFNNVTSPVILKSGNATENIQIKNINETANLDMTTPEELKVSVESNITSNEITREVNVTAFTNSTEKLSNGDFNTENVSEVTKLLSTDNSTYEHFETPSKKKVRGKVISKSTKWKRSTLSRPLVFMG